MRIHPIVIVLGKTRTRSEDAPSASLSRLTDPFCSEPCNVSRLCEGVASLLKAHDFLSYGSDSCFVRIRSHPPLRKIYGLDKSNQHGLRFRKAGLFRCCSSLNIFELHLITQFS